ncbi:hypothetical protein C8R46DRAFT_1147866 [Mycena filopes]|nr:hypothetical protein C8R46DRAFT_1147866 [Mycena filopes]
MSGEAGPRLVPDLKAKSPIWGLKQTITMLMTCTLSKACLWFQYKGNPLIPRLSGDGAGRIFLDRLSGAPPVSVGRAECRRVGCRRYQPWGWMVAASDPRVKLAVPIIACPDYYALMHGRATALGIAIGPPHFPDALLEVIKAKALTALPYKSKGLENPFLGKKVLVMSGASDALVPWSASEAFVEGLEVGASGSKEVRVFEGVGHVVTAGMVDAFVEFVLRSM